MFVVRDLWQVEGVFYAEHWYLHWLGARPHVSHERGRARPAARLGSEHGLHWCTGRGCWPLGGDQIVFSVSTALVHALVLALVLALVGRQIACVSRAGLGPSCCRIGLGARVALVHWLELLAFCREG